jgi:hypothetical protein
MRAVTLPLLIAAASAAAADLTVAQLVAGGKVLDHKDLIVETADAHEADTCRGFDLTDSQIRDFFRKATVQTAEGLKKDYKWAPCQVQGHILFQEQKLNFSVTAASTGLIEVAPGKVIEFACDASCADMFVYGYPVPAAPTVTPASSSSR